MLQITPEPEHTRQFFVFVLVILFGVRLVSVIIHLFGLDLPFPLQEGHLHGIAVTLLLPAPLHLLQKHNLFSCSDDTKPTPLHQKQ